MWWSWPRGTARIWRFRPLRACRGRRRPIARPALGLDVDVVVGDLDSATPEAIAAAEAAGARIERHPPAKDATDLELALDAARARGPARPGRRGAGRGRLDHCSASVLLLAAERYAALELDASSARRRPRVHGERAMHGAPGELITLVPLGGAGDGRHDRRARLSPARRDLGPAPRGASRTSSRERRRA